MKKNKEIQRLFLIGVLLLVCFNFYSCSPSINSFEVEPRTISGGDQVKVNWDVNGSPSLLVHEQKDSVNTYMVYTLVVEKGQKNVSRTITVRVKPSEFPDEISMNTTLSGDTLVARDSSLSIKWGDSYFVKTISLGTERELSVILNGKSTKLNPTNNTSAEFNGASVVGVWEIRSLLTESEKLDITTAPEQLSIKIIIKHK